MLERGAGNKILRVRVRDEGGLENLRKLVSRLSFRMTGNSSDEEGKNASGVHAHRDKSLPEKFQSNLWCFG